MTTLEDPIHPPSLWCQMRCIGESDNCAFVTACGFRKRLIAVLHAKSRSACRRYINYYGYDAPEQHVSIATLIRMLSDYMRDGFRCKYCGRRMYIDYGARCNENSLSLDHRIPLALGGTNHEDNLVFCCHDCNIRKDNKPEGAFKPKWIWRQE